MINEDDDWQENGPSILRQELLDRAWLVLRHEGPLILQHLFYRDDRATELIVIDEYDDFLGYLEASAGPGDEIHVWSFREVCRGDNRLMAGRYPDSRGRTPQRSA
jgi:hypothetical protein